MVTGKCLCGAVQYQSTGPALFSVICYCRDCQRSSGSAGVPVLGVPKASFTYSGPLQTSHISGGSGRSAVRNFCSRCGSMLFGTPESEPDLVTIYTGTLDEPAEFQPNAAIFTASRPSWAKLAAPLAEFAAHPEG